MICRSCGTENIEGAKFCTLCGANLLDQRGVRPSVGPVIPDARGAVARQARVRPRGLRPWVVWLDRIATPLLGLVILGLACLLVLRLNRVAHQPPQITDDNPHDAARIYLKAQVRGDLQAMYQTFAPETQARISFQAFQSAWGRDSLQKLDSFTIVDEGTLEPKVTGGPTIAYLAAHGDPVGPQTLFLMDEGGHWKVVWTPPIEEILGAPPPLPW